MAWEPKSNSHTLYIERHGSAKKPVYRLQGFLQVRTREGTTYMQPVPLETLALRDIDFDAVEFVEPGALGIDRTANAGELNLTRTHPDRKFGGRL